VGLHGLLHCRDVAAVPSWATIEGSQPLDGMSKSLGPVSVASLGAFDHGMNTPDDACLDAPPNISMDPLLSIARMRSTDPCLRAQRIAGMHESA